MPGMAPDDVEDLKKRLRQHDQMYAAMQQQGKPFEALEHLEKGLFVRKELFGPDHPEVGRVCQVFTTSCNTLAMNSLQRGASYSLPGAVRGPSATEPQTPAVGPFANKQPLTGSPSTMIMEWEGKGWVDVGTEMGPTD